MDEQADTVRIMSIHKSKGLEFPVVLRQVWENNLIHRIRKAA